MGRILRSVQSRGLAPCTPGSRVLMSAAGRDCYWRTPEWDAGGAWQGWDTKCSAELLAWHWLAVKLRFAGVHQRDGRDRTLGLNHATSLYGTLAYIHDGQPRQVHWVSAVDGLPAFLQLLTQSCPLLLALLAAVEWCDVARIMWCCATFRFIRPPTTSPLGRTGAPLTNADQQAGTSAAIEQRPATTTKRKGP